MGEPGAGVALLRAVIWEPLPQPSFSRTLLTPSAPEFSPDLLKVCLQDQLHLSVRVGKSLGSSGVSPLFHKVWPFLQVEGSWGKVSADGVVGRDASSQAVTLWERISGGHRHFGHRAPPGPLR